MAVSGNGTIFVTWTGNGISSTDIFLTKSTDGGSTFSTPINVSNNTGSSSAPAIAVTGTSTVFLVWKDDATAGQDIFVAKSTDGGSTFSTPVTISGSSSRPSPMSTTSVSAGDANDVFVAWDAPGSGNNDIFLTKSTDGGSTFSTPINVSNNAAYSFNSHVSAYNSSNIYLVWQDQDPVSGLSDIWSVASTDGGSTFSTPINVSNNAGDSTSPQLFLAAGGHLDAIWVDDGSLNRDIFFANNVSFVVPSVSIITVNNLSPRWDLDSVHVVGTANNAAAADTVSVDWGDGHTSSGIAISAANNSWSASHIYSSSAIATNPNQITAKLVDQSSSVLASSQPVAVQVKRHSTSLILNQVSSTRAGSNITATGSLIDVNEASLLDGKAITFNGTGAASLHSSTTTHGLYSATGSSPSSTGTLWTVQSHFAGDSLYNASDSQTQTYDTVNSSSTEFSVPLGAPSKVILTGFNASIVFDNTTAAGNLFVSPCYTPSSPRYISLGTCLEISSAVPTAPNSLAHVLISFAGKSLPSGYSANNIDLFHNTYSGITDITESRDLANQSVTGATSQFSEFIAAIAVHTAPAAGATRQQVFVGHSEVSIAAPSVSFDKRTYSAGDTPVITITDNSQNLRSNVIDNILANVSSTSSPSGIAVTLSETGVNTGIFTGSFSLTEQPSSGNSLHVIAGDSLMVSYKSPQAIFSVAFDNITEAGVVDMTSYLLNPQVEPIIPFGSAIDLQPVDVKLSSSGKITVTMSYSNVNLLGANPQFLRLFHKEGLVWVDVTLPDPAGHNLVEKTITGTADSFGNFTIGTNTGQQGGVGGEAEEV